MLYRSIDLSTLTIAADCFACHSTHLCSLLIPALMHLADATGIMDSGYGRSDGHRRRTLHRLYRWCISDSSSWTRAQGLAGYPFAIHGYLRSDIRVRSTFPLFYILHTDHEAL